jgi:hypothetical protein
LGQVFRATEGVSSARCDDRGSMLVVVEDRNAHRSDQLFLDAEAGRRGDVLEVDAAERGLEEPDGLDQELGILRLKLEVEDVDIGEPLEKDRLSLHDGLARQRADVPEPQHRRSVADDGDEVSPRGVTEDFGGVSRDLTARLGDPGVSRQRDLQGGAALRFALRTSKDENQLDPPARAGYYDGGRCRDRASSARQRPPRRPVTIWAAVPRRTLRPRRTNSVRRLAVARSRRCPVRRAS